MKVLLAWGAQFLGGSGGMERVCCLMANALASRGYDVGIMFCGEKDGKPFFPLSKQIDLFNMASIKYGGVFHVSTFDKLLRESMRIYRKSEMFQWMQHKKNQFYAKAIKKILLDFQPEVVIAVDLTAAIMVKNAMNHHSVIPMITMFHFPVNISLRCHTTEEKTVLAQSDVIQVLTKTAETQIRDILPRANVICIPNAVIQSHFVDRGSHTKPFRIIYVARIDKMKQQTVLIEAFSKIVNNCPDWIVELWGSIPASGSYVKEIKRRISELHLEEKVFIRGETKDIQAVYENGDILAFPSVREGFGLALAEGMSTGLPAVAFNSCEGANELIENEKSGYLVEDINDFADKLYCLMISQEHRVQMGRAGHIAMLAYEPEKIWNLWEHLLNRVAFK